MRLALFRVTLAGIAFTLTIGMGELFVRVLAPQPVSWLAIYRSHPELPFFSMLPNTELHVDTGETEWTVATDDRGFRVPLEATTIGQCAVLWLGDSFALGHGVEYEESFVGLIDEQTRGVRQINAAVAGYGPAQYRKTLEYLGKTDLDFDWIFVASYVGNDFHDTQWEKTGSAVDGILGNRADLKSFLKRNFHIYRLATATYHAMAGGDQRDHGAVAEQLARPAAWQEAFLTAANLEYASEMRLIQAFAEARGKKLVFLILPTREASATVFSGLSRRPAEDVTNESDDRRPMLPIERARTIFGEMGARYIDLTPIIGVHPADEMFFHFDGHLTPEGNRVVAEEILNRLDLGCERNGSGETIREGER